MAKASDNLFPYVHLVPAAAPSSPAAGAERVYLDSGDGNKLKRKNSSGTVTTIEGGGGGSGGVTLLKEIILGADTATISFTSTDIPSTGYRDLRVVAAARSTVVAATDNAFMALNADTTTANYSRQRMSMTGATASGSNAADRGAGTIAAASATAGEIGTFEFTIRGYRDTTYRKIITGTNYAGTSQLIQTLGWVWLNTAAVTSIDLTCGANFKSGSRFSLYGLL